MFDWYQAISSYQTLLNWSHDHPLHATSPKAHSLGGALGRLASPLIRPFMGRPHTAGRTS